MNQCAAACRNKGWRTWTDSPPQQSDRPLAICQRRGRLLCNPCRQPHRIFRTLPAALHLQMRVAARNLFGGRIVDDAEDADHIEIEFVPARIDYTEEKYGKYCSSLSRLRRGQRTGEDESDYPFTQTHTIQSPRSRGEKEESEYYDASYIGFWMGRRIPGGSSLIRKWRTLKSPMIGANFSATSISICALTTGSYKAAA